MKKLIAIILVLISNTSYAQHVVEAYLFAEKEKPIMAKFINNTPLSEEEKVAIVRLHKSANILRHQLSKKELYHHTAVKGDMIIVVVRNTTNNQIVPISTANIYVESKVGTNDPVAVSIPDGTSNYVPVLMSELTKTPSGLSTNEITVRYSFDGGPVKTESHYFRYLNNFSHYGVQTLGPVGFWFPVGQFGSNLRKTSSGMIFNALPLGVALGVKYNVSQKFYIGGSYAFNYTITGGTNAQKTFSFNSFSHGPLIDFGDLIHLGYNSFTNLSTDTNLNREPFVVIGIGSRVLKALKGSKE